MNKHKLILSSGIANTFEWYDYALFGHFANIIGIKFFPQEDPSASLLQAFLVFAIGYLMRPIGGIIFGVIGDKYGRRSALSAAIICMSIPTALVGLLPTYDTIGLPATILMILVRMLQGLSMGGALTGSVSFIIEHSDKKHRGILGSIPMAGICVGILLGSFVYNVIKYLLTDEQFFDWGWRLPFIIGIFILFAGVYIKKYTEETPLFLELQNKGEINNSPLKNVIKSHWFDIIISIFINSTGSVIFYLQAIYLNSYLKNTRGFSDSDISAVSCACYIIMAIGTVASGWLSDMIGRKRIFIILNFVIIVTFACGIVANFESGNFALIIVSEVIIAILAAAYIGPEPALQAEFYSTNVRNTALSVCYNTATSIFGGTTPFILEKLVQSSGTITYCTYYIIGCSVISLVALLFYKDRSGN